MSSLDDILLHEVVGHGSGGVVHRASLISTGKPLAVKVPAVGRGAIFWRAALRCTCMETS